MAFLSSPTQNSLIRNWVKLECDRNFLKFWEKTNTNTLFRDEDWTAQMASHWKNLWRLNGSRGLLAPIWLADAERRNEALR